MDSLTVLLECHDSRSGTVQFKNAEAAETQRSQRKTHEKRTSPEVVFPERSSQNVKTEAFDLEIEFQNISFDRMGLTLEFYMGDPAAIGAAVADFDFDTLYDSGIVQARADLSLHVSPEDLDTLSKEAAGMLEREPILLTESLGEAIGGDESDHGAFLVVRESVTQFAALETDQAEELTRRWMEALAREYDDPEIQVTPPAVEAVLSLISLCRRAEETFTPVIHAWFL